MVKPLDPRGLLALSHAILLRTDPEKAPTTEDPLDELFREMLTQYEPFVTRAATSYCWGRTALVPDVVNDTLFALWQSFPNFVSYDRVDGIFRLDIAEVELHRWLGAAVRNRCAAARRAEARHAERTDAYEKHLAPGLGGESDQMLRMTVEQLFSRAREIVSERDVAILRARHLEGRSPAEIAVAFGLKAKTVKNILTETLHHLRAVLELERDAWVG
jgi:RNA polymerase sigma factor (sigma-70 family)